jgi:hypothetical protein
MQMLSGVLLRLWSPVENCIRNIWEERNALNRAEQVGDREANQPMAVPEASVEWHKYSESFEHTMNAGILGAGRNRKAIVKKGTSA